MHTYVHTATVCEYTGTLLHTAEVRTKVLAGDGQAVPVLCMDLQLDNPYTTLVHSEQPYPAGCHSLCEAAAKKLKKGMRITVQAPLAGARLVLPNVSAIQVIPEPSNDLFTTKEPAPCHP